MTTTKIITTALLAIGLLSLGVVLMNMSIGYFEDKSYLTGAFCMVISIIDFVFGIEDVVALVTRDSE